MNFLILTSHRLVFIDKTIMEPPPSKLLTEAFHHPSEKDITNLPYQIVSREILNNLGISNFPRCGSSDAGAVEFEDENGGQPSARNRQICDEGEPTLDTVVESSP